MDLKDQVCDKELAQRIKKLGVKQESLWYWDYLPNEEIEDTDTQKQGEYTLCYAQCQYGDDADLISAFTVAELGEMLPEFITENKTEKRLHQYRAYCLISKSDNWCIYYNKHGTPLPEKEPNHQTADTEANARAKMLIYLLENKLIEEG